MKTFMIGLLLGWWTEEEELIKKKKTRMMPVWKNGSSFISKGLSLF